MKKNIVLLLPGLILILLVTAALLGACGESASPTSVVSSQITTTMAASNSTAGSGTTLTATATQTLGAQAARATQTVALANNPATTVAVTSGGTSSSTGPTTTPGLKGGVTMKEAYNLVAPQIQVWAKDAVLTTIALDPDDPNGLLADGRANSWFFTAVSSSLSKQDNWQVSAAVGTKPVVMETVNGDLDQEELANQVGDALPPVASLIDSNRLMEIARQNGGDKSDVPVGFQLHKPAKQTEALAFNLVFQNGKQVTPLRIDAQTGKLLDNVKG